MTIYYKLNVDLDGGLFYIHSLHRYQLFKIKGVQNESKILSVALQSKHERL